MVTIVFVLFAGIVGLALGAFSALKWTGVVEGWVTRIESAVTALVAKIGALETAVRNLLAGKSGAQVSQESAVKVAAQPVEASNGQVLKSPDSTPTSAAQSINSNAPKV